MLFATATAEGILYDKLWNQAIITPSGYALVEIAQEQEGQEKNLSLTEVINSFLQKQHSLKTIREFLASPVLQYVESGLFVIPIHHSVLVALKGKGSVWLIRNRQPVQLLTTPGVIKGNLNEGDFLVLTPASITVPHEIFKRSLKNAISTQELASTIMLLLQTYQSTGKVLFLQAQPVKTVRFEENIIRKKSINIRKYIQLPLAYVKKAVSHPQQRIRIIALVVGLGFFSSVLLGIRKQQEDTQMIYMQESFVKAEKLFTEAISIMERRREESVEKLSAAKALVDPFIHTSLPTSKTARDLKDLQQKIDDNLRLALRIYSVNLTEYFDASFLRQERVIDSLTRVGDTVFFLDRSAGFLGGVAIPTKNADVVVTSDALIGAQDISGDLNTVFLLNQSAVWFVTPQQTQPEKVVLNTEGVGTSDGLIAYGLNLYILDKQNRQLWRYIGNEQRQFSNPQGYFAEGQAPDLDVVTSVVIDGSIWMGTTIGKVFKFSQSVSDIFLPRGLDTPLGNTLYVYTSEFTNKVYVLDREQKRVVVFNKEGLYQGQYQWKEEISPSGIIVSEQQQRAILLADKKLYSFALQ